MIRFLAPALVVTLSFGAFAKTKRADGPDPCKSLTPAHVKAVFKQQAKGKRGQFAKNVCTYSWDVADKAAAEAAQQKAMQAYIMESMKARQEGRPQPPMPAIRTSNEVSVTYPRNTFKTKAQAEAAFMRNVQSLKEGITASVSDKTVKKAIDKNLKGNKAASDLTKKQVKKKKYTATFKMELKEVDGVGMKAAWASKQKQLGFVHNKQIWWLNVNVSKDDAENKAKAIELAKVMTK